MDFGSLVKRLNNNVQEAKVLGLSVMMRHVYRSNALSGGANGCRKIDTKIGPVFLRPHDSDNIVLTKIFVDREYDLDRIPQGARIRATYERILAEGKTPLIVDAGANIGLAARFFAMAYPRARIVSVEPDPSNCAVCRRNVEGFPNIEVIEAAIGAESGFVALESETNASWATRTQRAEQGQPVVTIADICARHPGSELLVVKIDIEGFESDLFSSNTEWADQAGAIIIEPHDWMMPGAGTSTTLQRTMMRGDRELLILGENLAWIKVQ